MRLNKFLSGSGVASRRKSDEIIVQGKVTVNGKTVTELGTLVNENKDIVCVEGIRISMPSSFVYLKLHKPKGYICSRDDEKGRKTIFDLADLSVRLFSIGRLDYDTEGLILLTNDGEFAQSLAHPSKRVEKEYIVVVEGSVLESELAVLRSGVVENGVRMPEARVEYIKKENGNSRLSVIIDEGQNRQIRRMFEGIGRHIVLLKRVRIDQITLGGLPRGKTKLLTREELASLQK